MNTLLRLLADLLLRFLRSLDLPLLAALLAIMGIGLATLYSASNESTRLVTTQGAYFCVGLGVLWVASRIPAHLLKQATPPIYVLSLLPLVLVLFIGSGKYGNHWINLGFFNFQPSELTKLTLPMMLAWTLDRRRLPPRLPTLALALLVIALPVGLILLQRDLGTAVLVLASGVPADIRTTVHDALLDRTALARLADDLDALGVSGHRLQAFRAAGCTNAALLG